MVEIAKNSRIKVRIALQPHYLPDLAPSKYVLFPTLKQICQRSESNVETVSSVNGYLVSSMIAHPRIQRIVTTNF